MKKSVSLTTHHDLTSFEASSPNQLLFRYLECVSNNMKRLQPFGDVPKKLTLQLRRSFVATRTFSQALQEGKKMLTKILKIPPRDKCVEALTKMTQCPSCQGLPAIRPCSSYCNNVMKGCLAYHSQLSDSWDKYIGKIHSINLHQNHLCLNIQILVFRQFQI